MNEHELLKKVADKIWYENNYNEYSFHKENSTFLDWTYVYETWFYWSHDNWEAYLCNVREIIFTTEFIDKFETYLMKKFRPNTSNVKTMLFWVLYKLNNPVDYLYDLIK